MINFKDDVEAVIAQISETHSGGVDQDLLKQQVTDLVAAQVAPIQAALDSVNTKLGTDEGASADTKAAIDELQGVVTDLANAVKASQSPSSAPAPSPAPAPAPDAAA